MVDTPQTGLTAINLFILVKRMQMDNPELRCGGQVQTVSAPSR
jgi:hypothetical protein